MVSLSDKARPFFLTYSRVTLGTLHNHASAMRLRSYTALALLLLLLCSFVTVPAGSAESNESNSVAEAANAESINSSRGRSAEEDSFADMIDRALEREFPENEQNPGSLDPSFNSSVCNFHKWLSIVALIKLNAYRP